MTYPDPQHGYQQPPQYRQPSDGWPQPAPQHRPAWSAQPTGWQQPVPQPAIQQPAPAPPPAPRRRSRGLWLAVAVVVVVLLGVGGYFWFTSSSSSGGFDVKLTGCSASGSMATVNLEVHNGGSTTQTANIAIEYRNGSGTAIDTGTVLVRDVPPGDTKRVEESTILDAKGDASMTCVVTGVG